MSTDGSAADAALRNARPAGAVTRLDPAGREIVLTSLLARSPDAVVMAFGADGLFVPVPADLPLQDHRLLQGYNSALELVPPSRMAAVIDSWRRAVDAGYDMVDFTLTDEVATPVQLHLVDLPERYGAMIGVLVGAAELKSGQSALPAFRPRRCEARKDARGLILAVDAAFGRMLGWTPEKVIGHRTIELVHPDDQERGLTNWMDMLAHPGAECRVRLRHRHEDGSWLWVEISNTNRLNDPDHGDVYAEMLDISDEMAAQEALRANESLLRALTEALPLGVLHFGTDRKLRYRNERVKLLLDRERAETVDEQLSAVLPSDRPVLEQALEAVLAGQDCDLEVRLRRARRCHLRLRPILGDDGEINGALLSVADITEDARLRDELRERATYDALTRCLNRAAILDELEAALARPSAPGYGTAVIFFDIDHFKDVNDRLGHGAGDQLLVAVARRLRATARADDLVGRLGGDEFLVVCRKIAGPEQALTVANRIAEALGEPLQLAHVTVNPKASIGVAWTDTEQLADALVDNADVAMYESKRDRLGRPVLSQV